jgi:hypothetical protein
MSWNEMNDSEKFEYLLSVVKSLGQTSSFNLQSLNSLTADLKRRIDALENIVSVFKVGSSERDGALH